MFEHGAVLLTLAESLHVFQASLISSPANLSNISGHSTGHSSLRSPSENSSLTPVQTSDAGVDVCDAPSLAVPATFLPITHTRQSGRPQSSPDQGFLWQNILDICVPGLSWSPPLSVSGGVPPSPGQREHF